MRGYPLERATSPDGRWAYTLYDGGDGEPFVHALDTAEGQAICVDLDGLATRHSVGNAHLTMSTGGERLMIATRKARLAVIDTRTLEATAPLASESSGSNDGGGVPWALVLVATGLGLAGGGALIANRHRRATGVAAPDS